MSGQLMTGQEAQLAAAIDELDKVYLERNQVVAALAKCFPSGTANTPIDGWAPEWFGCVYIDLPTGQASWHFHSSQAHLFADLPAYAGTWDGHTTPEKYARLAQLQRQLPPNDLAGFAFQEVCENSERPHLRICMGHGKIEVGTAIHEGLPALWFGKYGQGLGFERERNNKSEPDETLAILTFENIQGLEAVEINVARLRMKIAPETVQKATSQDETTEDLRTQLDLHKSWAADDRRRLTQLEQHLRSVLEIAETWRPDYATQMDRDTLKYAQEALDEATHQPPELLTQAAQDVLAERQRQITAEGWTPEHDDAHSEASLAMAAGCYCESAARPILLARRPNAAFAYPTLWPKTWSRDWWKPKDPRSDLVRAGALILAEIERLDRAAQATKEAP